MIPGQGFLDRKAGEGDLEASPLLKSNMVLRGPVCPEPVRVIVAVPMEDFVKPLGKGLRSGHVHGLVIGGAQLEFLEITP